MSGVTQTVPAYCFCNTCVYLPEQDAISRNRVGVKAAGLLQDCLALSLQDRANSGTGGADGGGGSDVAARDRYFEYTEAVLDALVMLHMPRYYCCRYEYAVRVVDVFADKGACSV